MVDQQIKMLLEPLYLIQIVIMKGINHKSIKIIEIIEEEMTNIEGTMTVEINMIDSIIQEIETIDIIHPEEIELEEIIMITKKVVEKIIVKA